MTKPEKVPCHKHPEVMLDHFKVDIEIFDRDWIACFCPECQKEQEADDEKKKQAEIDDDIQRRLDQCHLGRRFRGVTFDTYKPVNSRSEKCKSFLVKWAEDFSEHSTDGDSLILVGNYGTGKNTLAAAICSKIINDGHSAMHTTAIKLVRKIKDAWECKGTTEQSVIDSFISPSLLVIDEVGVQFGSPTEKLFLTEVINDRYEAMRPTIMISNHPMLELEALLGGNLIDRFRGGNSRVLVFDWESYRRNNAAAH